MCENLLEKKIKELIRNNGNKIGERYNQEDIGYPAQYEDYPSLEGDREIVFHLISIKDPKDSSERQRGLIIHEYCHAYFRELGLRYEIEFNCLTQVLVNLFDHYLLIMLINKYNESNEVFIEVLRQDMVDLLNQEESELNILFGSITLLTYYFCVGDLNNIQYSKKMKNLFDVLNEKQRLTNFNEIERFESGVDIHEYLECCAELGEYIIKNFAQCCPKNEEESN